nr:unnamed protein product [Digitaria exilis]
MAASIVTEAKQPPCGSSAATASYPPWVLFQERVKEAAVGSYPNAISRASSASAHTSTGHPIGVSLDLAAPPAVSSVHVHLPHGFRSFGTVLAVHGDSVLISISVRSQGDHGDRSLDHFVYGAGAASGESPKPPTLYRLPTYYHTEQKLKNSVHGRNQGLPVQHRLQNHGTGVLRRGEDEFVVAELKMIRRVAELLVLRHGQWSIERPSITIQDEGEVLISSWNTRSALPIGDTHLCWVDLNQGLLFCNIFDESPVLRRVYFPMEAIEMEPGDGVAHSSRSVYVTRGNTVKFVGVFPRCCCGGAGTTQCERSRHAYTINTWTLRMDTMVWVMDGMVDATELWALDTYEGLPRVPPVVPGHEPGRPPYHMLFYV